jgi:hypothetical protein
MTRNNILKAMTIGTVFLSVLPAMLYYAVNWKSIRNNTNALSERELGMFFIIAAIASVSHIGVSFVQSAVEIGGALFIVSVFIHLTKIASLVLLYLACKTNESLAPQLKV